MRKLRQLLARLREDEGITGLETAIILIAFVVVAAVFAFVVLSTGLFSSERGKEAVYAGLAKTRGTMELVGGIVATSNGSTLTTLQFGVTLAASGDSVNLNNADPSNRTVISYIDTSVVDNDMEYTTISVTGDGDALLEPGELLLVNIDLTAQVGGPAYNIGPNKTFVLEVKPPTGSYVVVQRLTPPSINETIINLY